MKTERKTYTKPEISVLNVEVETLLASGSGGGGSEGGGYDDRMMGGVNDSDTEGNYTQSNSKSLWD